MFCDSNPHNQITGRHSLILGKVGHHAVELGVENVRCRERSDIQLLIIGAQALPHSSDAILECALSTWAKDVRQEELLLPGKTCDQKSRASRKSQNRTNA